MAKVPTEKEQEMLGIFNIGTDEKPRFIPECDILLPDKSKEEFTKEEMIKIRQGTTMYFDIAKAKKLLSNK